MNSTVKIFRSHLLNLQSYSLEFNSRLCWAWLSGNRPSWYWACSWSLKSSGLMLIPVRLESQEPFGIAARVICPTLPDRRGRRIFLPALVTVHGTLLLSIQRKRNMSWFSCSQEGRACLPLLSPEIIRWFPHISLKVWGKEHGTRRLAGRYSLFFGFDCVFWQIT